MSAGFYPYLSRTRNPHPTTPGVRGGQCARAAADSVGVLRNCAPAREHRAGTAPTRGECGGVRAGGVPWGVHDRCAPSQALSTPSPDA
eukprot:8681593-Pyramimonas_sp.AAC.1